MPKSTGERWMGVPAAAEHLGVMPRTLYRFLDEGLIPAYRLGRVIRIKRADVDGFLESQRVAPGSLHHLYAAHDMDEDDHRDEASLPPLGAVSVSVPEAGRMLGLSRAESYRRARSGELAPGVPAIAFGSRLIRVSRFQLDRYLADRSRDG